MVYRLGSHKLTRKYQDLGRPLDINRTRWGRVVLHHKLINFSTPNSKVMITACKFTVWLCASTQRSRVLSIFRIFS